MNTLTRTETDLTVVRLHDFIFVCGKSSMFKEVEKCTGEEHAARLPLRF